MSKIIIDCQKIDYADADRTMWSKTDAQSYLSGDGRSSPGIFCYNTGEAYGDEGSGDGNINRIGDSWGSGASMSKISTVVDAFNLFPLVLIRNNMSITWDEAWNIASEDEKLVLIQYLPLK
jgi:hypothetical protein